MFQVLNCLYALPNVKAVVLDLCTPLTRQSVGRRPDLTKAAISTEFSAASLFCCLAAH